MHTDQKAKGQAVAPAARAQDVQRTGKNLKKRKLTSAEPCVCDGAASFCRTVGQVGALVTGGGFGRDGVRVESRRGGMEGVATPPLEPGRRTGLGRGRGNRGSRICRNTDKARLAGCSYWLGARILSPFELHTEGSIRDVPLAIIGVGGGFPRGARRRRAGWAAAHPKRRPKIIKKTQGRISPPPPQAGAEAAGGGPYAGRSPALKPPGGQRRTATEEPTSRPAEPRRRSGRSRRPTATAGEKNPKASRRKRRTVGPRDNGREPPRRRQPAARLVFSDGPLPEPREQGRRQYADGRRTKARAG
jgi:hypothetical protein